METNQTEENSNDLIRESEIKSMIAEAKKHRLNGSLSIALALMEKARRIAFENELPELEVDALVELGNAQTHSDPEDAFLHFQSALNLSQMLNDRNRLATVWGYFANLHRAQGRASEALECFQSALDIFKDEPEAPVLFAVYANLAGFYYELNRPIEGEKYILQAIALAKRHENVNGEAMALCSYAKGLQQIRKFDKALEVIQEAIVAAEKSENVSIIATAIECNGYIHLMLRDFQKAIDSFLIAFDMFHKQANMRMVASILSNLGFCYQNQNNDSKAIEYFEQALSTSREIGERRTESLVLRAMAGSLLRQGEIDRAYHILHEALAIVRTSGNVRNEALVLAGLAEVIHAQGSIEEAYQTMEQATNLLKNRQVDDKLIDVLTAHAEMLRSDGRIEEAQRIENEINRIQTVKSAE